VRSGVMRVADSRVSVVVITRDRLSELLATLATSVPCQRSLK
jgi:hypothetical protein